MGEARSASQETCLCDQVYTSAGESLDYQRQKPQFPLRFFFTRNIIKMRCFYKKEFPSLSIFTLYLTYTLFSIILIIALSFDLLSCRTNIEEETIQKDKPLRIISLAPNITEILFHLGAGDRIVGVTNFCNYPPEALSKIKIGGFTNPNLELIISLKPDLVIGTPNVGNKDAILSLKKSIKVDILLFKAENLEDFYKTIEAIGKAIHEEEKASNLLRHIKMEMDHLKNTADSSDPKRVLLSLGIEPVISAAANSYPGNLASIAGAKLIPPLQNIKGQINPYPIVSLEEIINLDPEIIIQTMMDPINEGEKDFIKSYWKQWESISAVQNEQVYIIPGDTILRPSPRVIDGVELLINLIHGQSEKSSL